MEQYNKTDLVATYRNNRINDGVETTKDQALAEVDTVLASIIEVLAKAKDSEPNKKDVRGRLQIVNFGTLELKAVKARPYRNPQDAEAEPTIKPAHNKVAFGLGKLFDEAVN